MPTANPRINVTLSPSLDALVARLADHQRVSKSQVLRELLEAAEPGLQRAVALMDAAQQANAEVRKGFAASLGRAQGKAEKVAQDLMRQLDVSTGDLVSLAEAVRGRRPSRKSASDAVERRKAPQDPPASNRGVRSSRRAAK